MEMRFFLGFTLLASGLWANRCMSGQTLYPIVDSNTPVVRPAATSAQIVQTNQSVTEQGVSVELKPTAIAPHGARGLAQISGRTVSLHVSRLDPGKYDLKLIRRTDEAMEPLGSLTIVDPTLGPSRQANDNKKEASANPESVRIDADVQMKLASEFKPNDWARIVLRGPGGNAVLVGKLK